MAIRGALDVKERCLWVSRVIQTIEQLFPQEEAEEFWVRAQRLLLQVEAVLTVLEEECLTVREAGRLLHVAGLYALKQAQYGSAERLLRAALGQRSVLFGADYPDIAESLNDLGALHYTRGDLDQAEGFFRQALALKRRIPGGREYLAIALNNVACVCRKRQNYKEAERHFQEALAIWQNNDENAHATPKVLKIP